MIRREVASEGVRAVTRRWLISIALIPMTLSALVACQSRGDHRPDARTEAPEREQIAPLDREGRPDMVALQRMGGPMDSAGAILLDRQRVAATMPDDGPVAPEVLIPDVGARRPVQLSSRAMPVTDAIRLLATEFLGRSYILDPSLSARNQTVTLELDQEMSDRDILDLLDALGALHGWVVHERADLLVFAPAANMSRLTGAPVMESRAAIPNGRVGARVFRLNHIGADAAAKLVADLGSEGAKTGRGGRVLVAVDRVEQLNRLGEIIAAFDQPPFRDVEMWTYQLTHVTAERAASTLRAIAQASGVASPNDALISFIEVPQLNRLMTISRDPSVLRAARGWLENLDQPAGYADRGVFLYRVQHVDPARLATLLENVFSDRLEKSKDDPTDLGMRIVVEPEEELVVITALQEDFADVYNFMRGVDIARQQVLIDVMIAEVTLSDSLQLGVEYFLQVESGGQLIELTADLTQLFTGAPAGSAFIVGSDGFALIQALQTRTEVSLLSRPRLYARDGDTATFQVGAEVPVITAALDSSSQTGARPTFATRSSTARRASFRRFSPVSTRTATSRWSSTRRSRTRSPTPPRESTPRVHQARVRDHSRGPPWPHDPARRHHRDEQDSKPAQDPIPGPIFPFWARPSRSAQQ